jgi:hypothetical protein
MKDSQDNTDTNRTIRGRQIVDPFDSDRSHADANREDVSKKSGARTDLQKAIQDLEDKKKRLNSV